MDFTALYGTPNIRDPYTQSSTKGRQIHERLWSFQLLGLSIGGTRESVWFWAGVGWGLRDSRTVVFHRPVQLFDSFLFYLDVSLNHLDVANGILVFHFRSLGRVYLEHGLL